MELKTDSVREDEIEFNQKEEGRYPFQHGAQLPISFHNSPIKYFGFLKLLFSFGKFCCYSYSAAWAEQITAAVDLVSLSIFQF